MRKIKLIPGIAIMLSATSILPAFAQSFTGKAYEAVTENCTTRTTSHVWSDGRGLMRSESSIGGINNIVITDLKTKTTYAINNQNKTITQIPFSGSPGEDPKAQWQPIAGIKVIDGHPCTGKKCNLNGQNLEVWTGTDTTCTVLATSNGTPVMKLKNWTAQAPNQSLFTLPTGYRTIDMTEMMKQVSSGKFDPQAMQNLYRR